MCSKPADQSQKIRGQILNRIEQHQVVEHAPPKIPNLAVFASPVRLQYPIISIAKIDHYMFESTVIPCGTKQSVGNVSFTSKQVEGGVWCKRQDNHNYFWELNEYGIIYNREWVTPETLTENKVDPTELYLPSHDILTQITNFIRAARSFYQSCSHADNIKIVAQLRQAHRQKLKFKAVESDRADADIRVSYKTKISAVARCLPQDLWRANEFERVLFGVSDQLVAAFNQQQSDQQLWWEMKHEWQPGIVRVCDE